VSFQKPNFIDNIAQTVPDYIIQNIPSVGGGGSVIVPSSLPVTYVPTYPYVGF
jgi:hypothetical protein